MSGNETNSTAYDYSAYYDMLEENFAPCNTVDVRNFGRVLLPTLYSLIFILGFIGNGLVVCVLVKHRNQTNLTDICLFNLALSDLLFVVTLPFYSHYLVIGQWTFGGLMCSLASGSHNTGFFSSIFFMVAMTLDRYVMILHTHTAAQYRTRQFGIALTLVIWVLSLGVSLPTFIFTKVTNESNVQSCSYIPENDAWKLYSLVVTNLLGLIVPLLVMIVCYSRIIPTLVNMRTIQKHRIVKLIISIMVVFFVFWMPYNIVLFLKFLKSKNRLQGDECVLETNLIVLVTVTESFAYIHCCLNPIIYAFVGQKFMKRVWQLLRKWIPGIPVGDLSDSSYRKSSIASRMSDVASTVIYRN